MNTQHARSHLQRQFVLAGCPVSVAAAGVDLAFHAMDEAIATLYRVCDAGTTMEQQIAYQLAPQLLAGTLGQAMEQVRAKAIAQGKAVVDTRITIGADHG